jgi:hypothetical protein
MARTDVPIAARSNTNKISNVILDLPAGVIIYETFASAGYQKKQKFLTFKLNHAADLRLLL